jgi:hypothetical protein
VSDDKKLENGILAYVTGLRSARKRPLNRKEICAWFGSFDPKRVNETLDRLVKQGRLKLTEDPKKEG